MEARTTIPILPAKQIKAKITIRKKPISMQEGSTTIDMNYNRGSTSGSSTGGGINQLVDTNVAGGVNSNFNKKTYQGFEGIYSDRRYGQDGQFF